ncbi:glycolate oxidase subunit GlcD [Priestia filamentosa]|uniref:Glycolate oxidase subunit GlcD n=1 Tax=Priestia filamentosa TaxID=1402861 RepID=A0A1X7EYG2_9BACI|nr:glycolate oxidase subunit GlcD [Priestia filamentosa]AKO91464.1 glycolate oxidase subunit GlcD [Priestia filamentosa]MDT3761555.1 glycolate oxidase subunit GlcD [Priestia filamentosa]OXS67659.1 glycolate oxidase subunit GlcD [Priestia filamentosa]RJS65137.1 glycolate oxidase subunit GlcD [Priestia filamentosa]WCM16660.1 glycolate oxidase subunit GlcD [Priestia filamentosa]
MILSEARQRFISIVGQESYYDSKADLLAYSYDATPGFQALPDAVLAPSCTEDVKKVVEVCSSYNIPIVPRGSGTNLCAGTCPTQGGIVLLFHKMNKILEIDEDNLTATVQPGVITLNFITEVEKKGLFYPPDPSSMKISTLGGNISENSGGLRGLKYGVTRDYVLGLEVVLANGDIIKTGGKLAKDVAGYDLTRLFVGSEGTLGIVTEATLKLIPKPQSKKTALALYNDLESAARSVSSIIAHKIIPTTLEFLDQPTLQVVEDFAHIGLPTNVEAVLLIEQDGPLHTVEKEMDSIASLCQAHGAISVDVASSEEHAEALRTARRSALSALARLKPTTILEDATVPRSQVAKMVLSIKEIAQKYNLTICTFGHAGDGNLHPTCLTDVRNKEEMYRVEQAFEDIFARALELGGTITGEHGVGEMKAPYLEWKLGEEGIKAMQNLKKSFDPQNILNPGKLFAKDTKKRVVISS